MNTIGFYITQVPKFPDIQTWMPDTETIEGLLISPITHPSPMDLYGIQARKCIIYIFPRYTFLYNSICINFALDQIQ